METFNGSITWQHLSNTQPGKGTLENIVNLLFSLLSKPDISFEIVIRSLNILQSLTDHDFGMVIIKQYLTLHGGDCLTSLLDRMVANVESKTDLSLMFNAISTYIEFLNLTNSPGPENYLKGEASYGEETVEGDKAGTDDESNANTKVQGKRVRVRVFSLTQ